MNSNDLKIDPKRQRHGFTLLEMVVVIAIMSILMTAGAIGLGGIGGKGVTSGVATAESLFEEARSIAVSQARRTRVMVAKDLTNNSADNLRRIVVASVEIDSATGSEQIPENWIISSRGVVLPDQTYFSQEYSKKDQIAGGAGIEVLPSLSGAKAAYAGSYFFYEFNAEGICTTPGTGFVVGAGARSINSPTERPRVTSAGKRDFGGFVVWRNGRTSVFRSPDQISDPGKIPEKITDLKPNDPF